VAAATACALAQPVFAEPRHAVYVDLLGKGGLYGVGYDLQLTHRFAVGAVASYYVLGGDHFSTASPYLAAYPWRHDRHSWFVQGGPQLVRRATPSPGPEWTGMSTTSFTAEVSTGYEYRHGVLVRAYVMASLGARFAPWLGVSVGWSL
jgi:hypothetical protein